MPHHMSCKKRLKTSEKARLQNKAYKSRLRHSLRAFRQLSDPAAAAAELPALSSQLDRLVKKRIIKRNMASRLKSRLARRGNALSAQS